MSADEPRARTGPAGYFTTGRGILALLFPLLSGPAAWFLHLNVSYSLVRYVCRSGALWLLHLTTAVSLALAAAGGFVAWRAWRRAGGAWTADDGAALRRSRFLAVSGLVLAVGFFLTIVVQAVPNHVMEPCP